MTVFKEWGSTQGPSRPSASRRGAAVSLLSDGSRGPPGNSGWLAYWGEAVGPQTTGDFRQVGPRPMLGGRWGSMSQQQGSIVWPGDTGSSWVPQPPRKAAPTPGEGARGKKQACPPPRVSRVALRAPAGRPAGAQCGPCFQCEDRPPARETAEEVGRGPLGWDESHCLGRREVGPGRHR